VGGIKGNFAMAGVFEKGKADVRFTARSAGGHASAPGKHTPVARIADFVWTFEHKKVFKRKMLPEVQALFEQLAPYAPFYMRLLFGNMWLFRPLLIRVLPAISAQAGAMLQTTIAFTRLSGSDAYNVLPQEATLGANMRFIPHEGMEKSLKKDVPRGFWMFPSFTMTGLPAAHAWMVSQSPHIRGVLLNRSTTAKAAAASCALPRSD
jgi:carboxypeptidase PM20D1